MAYTKEELAKIKTNKAIALKKIKEYWPDINQSGINAIMSNIEAETSFLATVEGGTSWKKNRNTSSWVSINENMDSWAKANNYTEAEAEAAYDKLTDVQKNGVRYQGDEAKEGGGYGALQITVNNKRLASRSDTLDKISKTLINPETNKPYENFNEGVKPGLAEGDFGLGLDLSFSYYKNEHHAKWTTGDGGSFDLNNITGHDLRYKKGGINRHELHAQKDKDGKKLKNPVVPKHVANAFKSYGAGAVNKNDDNQLDTKWKRDLLKKVEDKANSHFEMQLDGKTVSQEDLEIYYDYIDSLTYEEAVNEFGITADGEDFNIQTGPQDILDNITGYNLEVNTANAKGKLEAILADENTSVSQKEKAKERLLRLDQNLENYKENIRRKTDPAYKDRSDHTILPIYDFDTGEEIDFSDITNDNVTALVDQVEQDITEEYEDTYDTEEEKEEKEEKTTAEPYEFDVREARKLGLLYDKDGATYDPEQVENMMIKPEGLMDYEQYAGWLSKQEEDPEASFDDFYVSDYTPTEIIDEEGSNEEGSDNETEGTGQTYFDLRGGDGAFKESFLDKVGGVSSLIGLATGAIGLGAALKDVDIPKDPKLGPAFQQRLAESKRMAQQGLTPSELAKAHNDLDSSYATGIDNIVRGSAGNRAQFMAGLGGLDVARQSALMDIAVADAQMQRQNQEKYDSMMLMNEQYEAARQAKYQDAKFKQDSAKQAAGAALAGSSISMVADAIASRQANRYNKMKTEQLMMQMGYKATKNGKSGQDKVGTDENGDDIQTSWTLPSSDEQPGLLDGADQAALAASQSSESALIAEEQRKKIEGFASRQPWQF